VGKFSGSILEVVVRPARSIVNEMFFYLKKKNSKPREQQGLAQTYSAAYP